VLPPHGPRPPPASTHAPPRPAAPRPRSWTGGRAIFASGSPFAPITDAAGVTHHPAQANNAYIFPAIGMAAVLTNCSALTDEVFVVAAEALAEMAVHEEVAVGRCGAGRGGGGGLPGAACLAPAGGPAPQLLVPPTTPSPRPTPRHRHPPHPPPLCRLFPAFSNIRHVSRVLAARVAQFIVAHGLGSTPEGCADWNEYVERHMWHIAATPSKM
jgi:malic enzyme